MSPPSPGFSHLPPGGNAISGVSGAEEFTGRYYIDGKPIYRKFFTGTLAADGSATIAHGVTWDNAVTLHMTASNASNVYTSDYYQYLLADATNIEVAILAGFASMTYNIYFEYTV